MPGSFLPVADDWALPGADLQPPQPAPLAGGLLPAACEPVLLEVWRFAHRFSGLLKLDSVPTLAEIEARAAHCCPGPACLLAPRGAG